MVDFISCGESPQLNSDGRSSTRRLAANMLPLCFGCAGKSHNLLDSVSYVTENFIEGSSQINKRWINTAKDRGRWTLLKDRSTMTAEERRENNARMGRNVQSRPARYVNGVRLSDEEVANITHHKVKRGST